MPGCPHPIRSIPVPKIRSRSQYLQFFSRWTSFVKIGERDPEWSRYAALPVFFKKSDFPGENCETPEKMGYSFQNFRTSSISGWWTGVSSPIKDPVESQSGLANCVSGAYVPLSLYPKFASKFHSLEYLNIKINCRVSWFYDRFAHAQFLIITEHEWYLCTARSHHLEFDQFFKGAGKS